jgi:hypothetical protein
MQRPRYEEKDLENFGLGPGGMYENKWSILSFLFFSSTRGLWRLAIADLT